MKPSPEGWPGPILVATIALESGHDLRNSADFLVIDKVAKAITRPQGTPIEHTSIPFQVTHISSSC